MESGGASIVVFSSRGGPVVTDPNGSNDALKVSRRTLLKGGAIAGLAAGIGVGSANSADAAGTATSGGWSRFDKSIRAEFKRQGLVGGAVALVNAEGLLYSASLGHRSLKRSAPIDDDTHFLVASITKSMSSLLVATDVDQGHLGWDQPIVDAWPGFRAPTNELTTSLKVRDLLGMATGIVDPTTFESQGYPNATQVLQSVVNMPVQYPPNTTYFYNTSLYAVGGYLPLLAQQQPPADLEGAYANLMKERVFGPAGMTGARIADDPRGLVANYASGNGLDLGATAVPLPYAPVGSYAPSGGTLATLNDMAAYVRLQLRGGVSVNGQRVVSATNLAECWAPHIAMPVDEAYDPDTVSQGYGMGWINQKFKDGTTLVWHSGGIDGFSSWIGFMPERNLGLVVLNSIDPQKTGGFFYIYVLSLLLSERFGLNVGVPAKAQAAYDKTISALRKQGAEAHSVDRATVAPWIGYYEGGFQMVLDGPNLELRWGPRVWPIQVLPGGSYIFSGGLFVGTKVDLTRSPDGVPSVELSAISQTVRRTIGPD
jgi:beta-lactamase class C